jgi:hypothetical protein
MSEIQILQTFALAERITRLSPANCNYFAICVPQLVYVIQYVVTDKFLLTNGLSRESLAKQLFADPLIRPRCPARL